MVLSGMGCAHRGDGFFKSSYGSVQKVRHLAAAGPTDGLNRPFNLSPRPVGGGVSDAVLSRVPGDTKSWSLKVRIDIRRLEAPKRFLQRCRGRNLMRASQITSSFLLSAAVIVFAQDPGWKNKPVERWDLHDAEELLTHSPWAQSVAPQWVRDLSPDERRAGGDMQADVGKGVGLEGLIGIFDPNRAADAIARAHAKPDAGTVLVRWESARPVLAAAKQVADADTSAVDSNEYYAIAVHAVPTPKNVEHQLKTIAALKRVGKKDLKPARVAVLRKDNELTTIVYLFPRSAEITKRDGNFFSRPRLGG